MRDDTINRVARTLTVEGLSIADIQRKTGMAYNTVKGALVNMGAATVEGSFPRRWTHPEGQVAYLPIKSAPSVLTPGTKEVVQVSLDTSGGWPERWEKARKPFGKDISVIEITEDRSPAELSALFAKGAMALASIAHALQEVQDKPDWFELLNGQTDEQQVS